MSTPVKVAVLRIKTIIAILTLLTDCLSLCVMAWEAGRQANWQQPLLSS